MASSAVDIAKDLGRKLVNRVETRLGDDWGAVKGAARAEARQDRAEFRYLTGSRGSKKAGKPDPRKYPRASGNGR